MMRNSEEDRGIRVHGFRIGALLPVIILAAFGSASAGAQPAFEFDAVTLTTYTPSPGMGTGVAVADFDGDGDPDIFLPTGGGTPNLLFRNRGDGTFDEIAAEAGLDDTRQARVALWVDYDGDGDLDLFVGRDCFFEGAGVDAAGQCSVPLLSLFEQRSDGFSDISGQVGLNELAGSLNTFHAGGLSAGDVSGDGLPDIYFARWLAGPELYLSDTLFIEEGEASGYSLGSGLTPIAGQLGGEWQVVMHDFDGSGYLDLFVNVDFGRNQLWRNSGTLDFFNDAVSSGVSSNWNEMGVAAGDHDNDGDLDLYVTNIHDWNGSGTHNLLLRNDSEPDSPLFVEQANTLGVENTDWGWGTTWLDVDNDGDLDLAATNGYCEPPPDGYCNDMHQRDRSRFFENSGDGSAFVEVGQQVGFDDTFIGAGLIAADFDGDGRLDLLQTAIDPNSAPWQLPEFFDRKARATIYFNRPTDGVSSNRFVKVKPSMAGSNSRALGAVVRLYMNNGDIQTRLVQAGESWMSQAPASLHFGLGATAQIVRLEIDWPGDDANSVYQSLPMNVTSTFQGPESLFGSGFE